LIEYKDIDDRYVVSSDGDVYSPVGQLKKQLISGGLYHAITIRRKSVYVHRLVAEVFIPNPEGKPDVAHVDGNGLNNNVTNLRWSTEKENMADKLRHGTLNKGETHGNSKLSQKQVDSIRSLRTQGASVPELADLYKVSKWAVYDLCNPNRTWK
jgi:hypothetical protein